MRGRSLNVHGRTSSEPRSALAHSQGRMPGERITGGVFLWLPFFAQALRRRKRCEQRSWPRSGEGQDARSQESYRLAAGEWKLALANRRRKTDAGFQLSLE